MNNHIHQLFKADQSDRKNNEIGMNSVLLSRNDKDRKKSLINILKENKGLTGRDYYFAAFIFHHGPTIGDSITATKLSEKSFKLGYKKALKFYALCLDRLLIKQGKKQKFGTQYWKKNPKSKWQLMPYDKKTTDEERKKYNVAPFYELVKHVEQLNEKVLCIKK
ncbi:MAG: hypothetical protein WC666_01730 [Candidatus Paceibacterota bacterium]|jgi:hypothetical protein